MRTFALGFSCAVLALLVTAAGCTPAPTGLEGGKKDASSAKKKSSSKASSNDGDDDDDDDADAESTSSAATTGTGTTAPQASKFACSGAGIAAFADALVQAGRKSCTSEGTGVVRNDNYQCVKTAIDSVGPAHPDTAYSIVTTLLAPNKDFPNLECTYFIQMVTSGVCGEPLSPSDMKWQDYPLAHEFINKAPAGWKWFANNGTNQAALGDIFVYDTTGGQDPGHIMIVAEVLSGGKFRIAEANELTANGSPAQEETGVMSNTRVTSLNDPEQRPAGWFRLAK
jgi:hypothetical protein